MESAILALKEHPSIRMGLVMQIRRLGDNNHKPRQHLSKILLEAMQVTTLFLVGCVIPVRRGHPSTQMAIAVRLGRLEVR